MIPTRLGPRGLPPSAAVSRLLETSEWLETAGFLVSGSAPLALRTLEGFAKFLGEAVAGTAQEGVCSKLKDYVSGLF